MRENFTNIALTSLAGGSPEPEGRFAERGNHSQYSQRRSIELPSQNRERRFSDRNSDRVADTDSIARGKNNKGRKRRGERASPLSHAADQMVHINQFELRSDSGHWQNTLLYFSLQ